ncbi:hypothetical protein [Dactylosporangium salmoneum]|uniref:Uncharacterized protein n=1 Tax=Dactylosporangium salmoneum TaxID=53361 RepID=A0ABP5T801_9ACTN
MAAPSVVVAVLPDCDIHRQMFGTHRSAEFDAPLAHVPGRPGAYLCGDCLPTWGPGEGSGLVQRLTLCDFQPATTPKEIS